MHWDADDELPPRALLDAWKVPEASSDLENAIMNQIDAAAPAADVSRRPNSLIVPLLAGIAAAALVVAWLAITRNPPAAPAPVVGPAPVAEEPESVKAPVVTPELGMLTILTEPDDATVEVDGRTLEGSSPFIISGVEVGETVEVDVSAPGRLPLTRSIQIPTMSIVNLDLPEKSVMVSTELTPPSIELELEAVSESGTTRRPVERTFLLERDRDTDYFLIAKARHHLDRRLRIGFSGRSAQFIDVVLEPDPRAPKPRTKVSTEPEETEPKPEKKQTAKAMTATLLIGTNMGVDPAKVYIDGKFIGTTPQSDVAVTPGRHTIKWSWANGRKVSQTVTLEDGQRKVVKAG